MMRRYIVVVLFILTCLPVNGHVQDHNGIWVVRHALKSGPNIETIINTARELNISDIYIQVRALGMAYYPSEFGPVANLPVHRKSNLQHLIKLAHQNNIKIHAWLNILYVWSAEDSPSSRQHVFIKDKNSVLRQPGSMELPAIKAIRTDGVEGYYLDPDAPSNFSVLKLQIRELINEYGVDGIHLDYFRYPGLNYSFSPGNRSKFKKLFFEDPENVYKDPQRFISSRGFPAFKYMDQTYKSFLRNNLNGFLGDLRNYIESLNSRVIISVAVKPNPEQARQKYFQDWAYWLDQGLCDRVLLMNYHPKAQAFTENVNRAVKIQNTKRVVIGISTFNQETDAVIQRVNFVKKQKLAGYALFSYNYLNKNQQMLKQILSGIKYLD